MSKKLICLFLGIVMLLGVVFTACGEQDDDAAKDAISENASQSATTLVLYLMSEKPVDSDTEKLIEDAVNKITKNKFKTKLDLRIYPEDEYYAKLDAAFAERDERKANGTLISSKQEAESAEDETEINSHGLIEIKYPTVTGYQVDIFYLGGKVNYDKYLNDKRFARLDDELSTSSKELTSYIPNQYFSTIKSLNGKATYAIPTAKTIGEYTYLLLNKEALKKAQRGEFVVDPETGKLGESLTDYSTYTSLTCEDVKDFLDYISESGDYTPMYTNMDSNDLIISNLKYWGVDENGALSDAFSVLGGYYGKNDQYLDVNKYADIENLFANSQFVGDIQTLKEYELRDYYDEKESANGKFAVGYVRGGSELAETYGEDYVMLPIELPRLSEEELYSDLFAVCAHTSSVSRSMKILTFLNTDETIRNLILYGIEDTHYRTDNTEKKNAFGDKIIAAERLEKGELNYLMDINKTGNTLIAYPETGSLITYHDHAVVQNQDALVRLDMGYTLDYKGYVVDMDSLEAVRQLSAKILGEYNAWTCDEAFVDGEFREDIFADKFAEFVSAKNAEISGDENVKANLACQLEEAHGAECTSLYCGYYAWLKDKKIIK